MPTPSFLWITDPWSTLDHFQDTTLRLMQEGINMGIPTFWSASDQVRPSKESGTVQAVELRKSTDSLNPKQAQFTPFPLSTFHQIHYRVDPPVNRQYRALVDELLAAGARESQILNPPTLIKNQSEKIPPPDLQAFTPRLRIVQNESDLGILAATFSKCDVIVSKPLFLAQSIGVQKHPTPKNTPQWKSLLENLTDHYRQEILIEEFLPEIQNGEVRLWFAGEKFIAALKKYPKQGDFRVLIDEGSRVAPHELTAEEQTIATAVGKSLKKQGILLAAVDLIGNKICDYNITSPGLLVQLEKVHGKNFAKEVLTQALQFHARQDRE